MQRPGLLPYAALTRTEDRVATLRQVARRIEELPDRREQSNLSAASGVLAALSLDKELIKQILRRDIMQQSPLYQEWQEEAELRGAERAQKAIALKLLEKKRPLEEIAEVTGFSLLQLQQLQENQQA